MNLLKMSMVDCGEENDAIYYVLPENVLFEDIAEASHSLFYGDIFYPKTKFAEYLKAKDKRLEGYI